MPKETNSKHCSIYSIKPQRTLYQLSNLKTCGMISSMNIWSEKYVCITLFVYAYSLCWVCNYYNICGTLNFVGTSEKLTKIVDYLKSKFEMKDPGKQFFFRGLQIEYFSNEILVY